MVVPIRFEEPIVTTTKTLMLAAAAAVLTSTAVAQEPAAPPKATYFEAAKISVSERARADGFMRVRDWSASDRAKTATG